MKTQAGAATHVGRRGNNEDALACDAERGLFVVADGMGGYAGGEVASRVAVSTLRRFLGRCLGDEDVFWPYPVDLSRPATENMIKNATRLAHERIVARKAGPLAEMGSTVALLVLTETAAIIGHVGDSRVYRLRDGALTPLTRDHSLYEELKAQGNEMPPKKECTIGHIITRALGIGSSSADVRIEELREGDVFLLATDGLTEPLSEPKIQAILERHEPSDAAVRLVEEAYAAGGKDNITVIVVMVC